MLEYLAVLSTGIAIINGAIMFYMYRKTIGNPDFIIENIEEVFEYASKDEEFQKKVFYVGAILGNGVKTGMGLDKMVRGGKMNMKDLLSAGIQMFLGRAIGGVAQQEPVAEIASEAFPTA